MSSVGKIFQILETVVAHQERGLAYSEVVARTALPKATAHRILKSLLQLGYLRFDAAAARYFGDLKLCSLGSAVTSHFDLKEYVRPHLLKLQAETRHTCNLGVLSGDAGVYLDKLESAEAFGIKLYSAIGKRFPLHCTAMGKVLLAGMPSSERRKLLAGKLESFTLRTITAPLALERELARVRRSGYAVDREEITRGIMCVAAPILDGEGETLAAISTAFPTYVIEERGVKDEIRAVTRCAAEATRLLAGESDGHGASRRSGGHPTSIAKKRR
ncbi:MAG TPA: IclR family transcriptional regulator [Candidatus Methylomirabilis sp.]|nr:IclR family transcriptional regulator [Candidatus Methylomirabilis sp.]